LRYAVERKHARYSLDVRAKLIVDGQEFTVRTLDISEGGIGVISPVEIPEGKTFIVEFAFSAVSGVFRAELQAKNRNGFRYGFQFVILDESNAALLGKYERRWGILARRITE